MKATGQKSPAEKTPAEKSPAEKTPAHKPTPGKSPGRKAAPRDDAQRVWKLLVTLVMDSRGDWRRKVSEATGLPFSRARALWRLELEARTLSELAHELGTDAPAATVIVNDLERRGLVERRPLPDDRRTKRVSLTAAGRRLLALVDRISDRPPQAIATLPAVQLAQLRRLLEAKKA